MEDQIKNTFRKAMRDKIKETVSSKCSIEDAKWICSLLIELVSRINSLTPNRKDLHNELNSSVDIELVEQMLVHGAAEDSDLQPLCGLVLKRLGQLCAPVQDQDVNKMKEKVSETSGAECLSVLLCEADLVLSEIEKLHKKAIEDMNSLHP
tara:strand:+ start:287 stop:739 length:453 start_codon:yes stop_codon:yes gene_type:complete